MVFYSVVFVLNTKNSDVREILTWEGIYLGGSILLYNLSKIHLKIDISRK